MKLILVRGIPGSGKSTVANELANINTIVCEADQFFMIDGEYKFIASQLRDAHKWCQAKAAFHLKRGYDVIVANTSLSHRDLNCYNNISDQYDATFNIINCNGKFKSIHEVPDEVMERMTEKYKAITDKEWNEIRKEYNEFNEFNKEIKEIV